MAREATDVVRQIAVAAGAALAIAGAAWGSGAFGGTPIQEAAGGALAPDATLLGAATPAFQIWSVIYLGLALFAAVQALPSRATSERYRQCSWLVLASMVLNAAWIAVVQAGWLLASLWVLLAIVVVLVITAKRLAVVGDGTWVDRAVTEVTLGIYLGWSLVASAANLAAVLDIHSTGLAVAILAIVLAAAALIVMRFRNRAIGASVMLAAGWGLAWIGVARLDQPENMVVAVAAFVASALAVIAAAWTLTRRSAVARP